MCGYAEALEFPGTVLESNIDLVGERAHAETMMVRAAEAIGDFYFEQTPHDGIPFCDTGAPHLTLFSTMSSSLSGNLWRSSLGELGCRGGLAMRVQ